MKINIENCVRHCGADASYRFTLIELVGNLKELRARSEAGDCKKACEEFFEIYKFDNTDKS